MSRNVKSCQHLPSYIASTYFDRDGEPSWLKYRKEGMAKSSLSFASKFWWVVVWLQLMPIQRDSNQDELRVVVVYSMIEGFKINFGQIIIDKIHIMTHKTAISLIIFYLVTELCRLSY